MPLLLISPQDLYPGAPYAYAAVAQGPGLVYTAGACPLDASGAVVAAGDIPAQMRQALQNLQAALGACGCGLQDVLKTTVYVVARDREDLVSAWREVEVAFETHPAPSTLVGVAFLGYRDQLVEIEAVAQQPKG